MFKKIKKLGLLPYLVVSIVTGIIIGNFCSEFVIKILATFNSIFGDFLNFLVPLILLGFLTSGISRFGKKSGKMIIITLAICYIFMTVSSLLSYFVGVNVFPYLTSHSSQITQITNLKQSVEPFFTFEIPPVMSVTSAIILSFILGLGISRINGKLKLAFDEFEKIISGVIKKTLIPLIPIHVLGIFSNISYTGTVYGVLSVFSKAFLVILLLQILLIVVSFIIAGLVSKKNPFFLLKNILPAYFTGFCTGSSVVSIPTLIKQTLKNDVSKETAEFAVPFCTNICICGGVISITGFSTMLMLINGLDTNWSTMLPFIFSIGIIMIAAPRMPGGGAMATVGILQSLLNFDPSMISLIMVLHITQDNFGTACNVANNGAISIIINKYFGSDQKNIYNKE